MTAGLALRIAVLAVLSAAASGCALNGDFGRVRSELVSDDMHAWVGTAARKPFGVPRSVYPLTDDERQLRDLAYQLIQPPYEQNRWYAVLNEYGLNRTFQPDWYKFDVTAYCRALMSRPYRSATARYVTLNDDIRNEVTRLEPFFMLARRIADIDRRREATRAMLGPEAAPGSSQARVAENLLIIAWVQQALADKSGSYRYTLERLVVATPAPMASEVEVSLTLLNQRIAESQVVQTPMLELPARAVAPISGGPFAPLKRLATTVTGK